MVRTFKQDRNCKTAHPRRARASTSVYLLGSLTTRTAVAAIVVAATAVAATAAKATGGGGGGAAAAVETLQ